MNAHPNKKGIAFVVGLIMITLLVTLAAVWIYSASTEITLNRRNLEATKALYLAEAGVEHGIFDLSSYIINNLDDPPDPPQAGSISGNLSILNGYTLDYSCARSGNELTLVDEETGTTTYSQNYLVQATATPDNGTPFTVKQLIARQKNYVFQYAVFYADDLEVFPGQNMTFAGRIHCNKDIYIGADGAGTTLTIDSEYLRSSGEIFGYRKNNNVYLSGTVSIKVKDTLGFQPMRLASEITPLDCTSPDWTDESQIRWNGTVKSSVHDVGTIAHPLVASIQPAGFYSSNAGFFITNDRIFKRFPNGQVIELFQGAGMDLPPGTVTVTSGDGSNPMVPSLRNQREGRFIYMTNVDLKKLAGFDGTETPGNPPNYPNNIPDNGLIYISRDNVPAGMQGGVRLKNGSIIYCKKENGIRDIGLTVVTNLPIYIQGDYNKDDASNGFIKKPCAVICDVVNLLSNNWNDSNSQLDSAHRVAVPTEINTAFLGGVNTTAGGVYNGGLENYPRLLENWSGVTLSIKGAFAEMWQPQVATGSWIYGTSGGVFYYTAPIRDWHYDTDFNNTEKLPPFTPFVLGVERKIWWTD